MSYEHPLAYLVGIEGAALLRAFTGEHDREFVEARLAEIRALLADEGLAKGVEVAQLAPRDGYARWAAAYDSGENAAFADEPHVAAILDAIPPGRALDAACGTGRLTRLLVERGHRVVAVDGSPEMLSHAEADSTFVADLHELPVDDGSQDVVLCGLALPHVPDLMPVVAEFARVLAPGGHLVLSDVHPEQVQRGSIPSVRTDGGDPARVRTRQHRVGDYLRAFFAAGLAPVSCQEPRPAPAEPRYVPGGGPWDLWPWSLNGLVPDALAAAAKDVPSLLIWHCRKAG
ncbi:MULTISPECIES: class I SAM-dependent methyltransferase [Amycolatopsis]|uniref:Class I SAM-dependent methyltransferase n=1 Tax=Amycolatopsis dendrobii TaxID=2760662 RepID=A0A7W3ZBY6_9PSEU|nr:MULTISPECIES: class I SAM-dependent methyltransferase [Amycolatopsis]MBB1155760.1 class I SAM-dependent methyltransferase [Amycolatopsis dendrobii]UKD52963.1 class I SAM-dependent methyltransferase [Amycolatopsis sp. FU40]